MNADELRAMSGAELDGELLSLREEQFRLRMQKRTGQLRQTHLPERNRRAIARLKTIAAERAAAPGEAEG